MKKTLLFFCLSAFIITACDREEEKREELMRKEQHEKVEALERNSEDKMHEASDSMQQSLKAAQEAAEAAREAAKAARDAIRKP